MDMNSIRKVTIFRATATLEKGTGKIVGTATNKWLIGVFFADKDGKESSLPLADFCEQNGIVASKDFRKYLGVLKHSRAVVYAHEFATEFGYKATSRVTDDFDACRQIVDKEDADKAKEREFNAAHPELAATRKYSKAVTALVKAAEKSSQAEFKKDVLAIGKKSTNLLARLEAEVAAAEKSEESEKAAA